MKKKKLKTMDEVSKGYEAFIKGKELKGNSKSLFKASTIKPRGSK